MFTTSWEVFESRLAYYWQATWGDRPEGRPAMIPLYAEFFSYRVVSFRRVP